MANANDELEDLIRRLESGWLPGIAEPPNAAPSTESEREREVNRGPARWWEPGTLCWHCLGAGRCGCLNCDAGGVLELRAGPCVVCCGTGRIPEKAQ